MHETGHGLGFALLALAVATAPLAGWPFPGAYSVAMACAGLVLMVGSRWLSARPGHGLGTAAWGTRDATASGDASGDRGKGPGSPAPAAQPSAWSHAQASGFFLGIAVFCVLFVAAGDSAGAFEGPTPGTEPPVAGLEDAGAARHTFRMDPSRYVALGAPSTSVGPVWPLPAGAKGVEGTVSWDAGSGLSLLQVTLEREGPEGWVEAGRWSVGPGGRFDASVEPPAEADEGVGAVRLAVRPTSANPSFEAVDVDVDVTFMAPGTPG